MNKKKLYIITASLLLVVAPILLFIYYTFFSFHLDSTSPDAKRFPTSAVEIRLTFNKNIKKTDDIKVTSTGANIYIKKISEKTIYVGIDGVFDTTKPYSIDLENIHSEDNYLIDKQSITIQKSGNDDLMKKEDWDAVSSYQDLSSFESANDPIYQYLPHGTLSYQIDPVVNGFTIEAHIKILLANADTDEDKKIYEQEARTYLKSIPGFTEEKYPIFVTSNKD